MPSTKKSSKRIATLTVLGTALAILPAAGVLRAQTNPNTALNAAKSGAQTANSANQSAGQTNTSQPKPQTQPKAQPNTPAAQTPKQGTAAQTPKTPAQPAQGTQASQTKTATTAATTAKPGATSTTTGKPGSVTGKSTPVVKQDARTMAQPASGVPKTVPVAAKPTPAAPAPAPAPAPEPKAVEVPKPAEPMIHAIANRRDPFSSLIGRETRGGMGKDPVLPPGKAGLQVETLVVQGLVRGPNGMIAVVANPQQRVYFLHEGDSLFDGKVDRITIEGVTFHEMGKDAFGKPLERDVTKRINVISSGEQP